MPDAVAGANLRGIVKGADSHEISEALPVELN
jgi:hypothetical protein